MQHIHICINIDIAVLTLSHTVLVMPQPIYVVLITCTMAWVQAMIFHPQPTRVESPEEIHQPNQQKMTIFVWTIED